MTPTQSFKAAILSDLAEKGYSPAAALEFVKAAAARLENPQVKQADLGATLSSLIRVPGDALGSAIGAGGGALARVAPIAATMALAAPIGIGGTAGYMLGSSGETDAAKIEAIKGRELIDRYKALAEERRQAALRKGLRLVE